MDTAFHLSASGEKSQSAFCLLAFIFSNLSFQSLGNASRKNRYAFFPPSLICHDARGC